MRALLMAGLALAAGAGLAACQKKTEAAKTGEATDVAATAATVRAGQVDAPKRRPGLWKQAVSSSGAEQLSRICLDAATDAQLSAWGQAMGKDTCSRNVVTPTAGGWKFEAVCDMGRAGKMTTTGEATGDFDSRYVVRAKTVTTGSSMPQADGEHAMELTATWEGPCPAGMKPGDVTLSVPGMAKGMTMNLADMMPKK